MPSPRAPAACPRRRRRYRRTSCCRRAEADTARSESLKRFTANSNGPAIPTPRRGSWWSQYRCVAVPRRPPTIRGRAVGRGATNIVVPRRGNGFADLGSDVKTRPVVTRRQPVRCCCDYRKAAAARARRSAPTCVIRAVMVRPCGIDLSAVPPAAQGKEERTMAEITEREQRQIDQANSSGKTPVVFIHGLWLLPSSWDNWVGLSRRTATRV
jgi:hypothetical protein